MDSIYYNWRIHGFILAISLADSKERKSRKRTTNTFQQNRYTTTGNVVKTIMPAEGIAEITGNVTPARGADA